MAVPDPTGGINPYAPNAPLNAFVTQNQQAIAGLTGKTAPANAGTLTPQSSIYMGRTGGIKYQNTGPGPYKDRFVGGNPPLTEQTSAYSEARTDPTRWDAGTLKKFVNTGIMKNVPGFDVGMGMPEILAAWDDMVKSSFTINSSVKNDDKKWSPWDILDSYGNPANKFGTITKDGWQYDVATGERIKYVGKTTQTSTQKNIDLSNPGQVKAIVTDSLRQLLGRAPTDKELAQYRASINGYENENPAIQTTTTTATPESIAAAAAGGGSVFTGGNTSSVSAGGVTDAARQQLISDSATQGPEYGKFQSATTYWNAMMQMISGG